MLKCKVKDIMFKGTVDMLKSCALQNGKVPMVSIHYLCTQYYKVNCSLNQILLFLTLTPSGISSLCELILYKF